LSGKTAGMSRVVKVATWAGKARASAVFVHGLGGHAYDTWRRNGFNDSFWPIWLAEDTEGLTTFTVAYEAPPSNWLGTSMALQDRAVNLLESLLRASELRDGPVVFVCHSLGGLLVKQLLLDLDRQKGRRPEAGSLLERITGVAFLATPHTGSRQAGLLDRLRFLAWPSPMVRMLVANDPTLRAINLAYRELAQDRRDTLRHIVFYETWGTQAGVIVDEASADPGLPGLPPIPIDADHIRIAKPADRNSLVYARLRDFMSEHPPRSIRATGFTPCDLPPIRSGQPWNILPKLVRVALLLLVATISFKGVQALIVPPPPDVGMEQRIIEGVTAALTRQLLANSITPLPPGAEGRVLDAVAAAAKGASAGDPRLRQALDLLRAGRIAEAAALFEAIAAEKAARVRQDSQEVVERTARIRQDSQDAAGAYRNLGAIAGLGDPQQALDAYRRAVEFDPKDIESLLAIAWIEKLRDNHDEAEQRFRHILQLATGNGTEIYRCWARLGLGDVMRTRGNLTAATNEYGQAKAIAERRMRADPRSALWQLVLGASYMRAGSVLEAQANLTEALRSYRTGLAIVERLAKANPDVTEWQRDLSAGYNVVGGVLAAQGSLAEALRFYRAGLAIVERLVEEKPGNALWQHDLAVSHSRVGDVLKQQASLAEALRSYRNSLAITERLARADPSNASLQHALSASYVKVGEVLVAQGSPAEALRFYRAGLAIAERLARSDPGNAEWQRDLSVLHERVGDVLLEQGSLAEALHAYQNRLAIIERLARSDPSNASWQRHLSVSYNKVGDVLRHQASLAEALRSYRAGLAIAERLAQSDPSNTEWQRDMSASYERVGNVLVEQDSPVEALRFYRAGLAIVERLARSDSSNASWQRDVSVFHEKVGDVLVAQGSLAEALQSYRKSLVIAERLAKADPGNAGWQWDLALTYAKIAPIFLQTEEKAEALRVLTQGRAIMASLTRLSPDHATWQQALAWFDQHIAVLTK
jgi:tetratricopeptide (TPR) repeat protein